MIIIQAQTIVWVLQSSHRDCPLHCVSFVCCRSLAIILTVPAFRDRLPQCSIGFPSSATAFVDSAHHQPRSDWLYGRLGVAVCREVEGGSIRLWSGAVAWLASRQSFICRSAPCSVLKIPSTDSQWTARSCSDFCKLLKKNSVRRRHRCLLKCSWPVEELIICRYIILAMGVVPVGQLTKSCGCQTG